MDKSISKMLTDKWKNIILEYEKVKKKKSTLFPKVQMLCEAHNISRKQLAKYYIRWLESGKNEGSLLPKQRGPRRGNGRMLNKEQERILIKIQRRFEAKPLDVWCLAKGVWELHPSVKTVARTLKRYPLNKKKKIIHRYEKKIPGELIHGDTFYIPKHIFEDKKQRFLLGLVDDCTRLTYVEMIEKKEGFYVGKTFLRGGKWFDLHGIDIEALMTDNGTEFTICGATKKSLIKDMHTFEILLAYANITHKYIRPYTPKTNGKVERFWKVLRNEFLPGLQNLSIDEFNEKLKKFMYYFNYQRPHGGIKYQTPFEKLKFVTETLG
jgi:transposase InsO family protein